MTRVRVTTPGTVRPGRPQNLPTGVEMRHEKGCAARKRQGARCNCTRSYRGGLWDAQRKANDWGPWTASIKEAQAWRAKATLERQAGRRRSRGAATLREAVEGFLNDADSGIARDSRGSVYKPSTLRTYRSAWDLHIEPDGLAPHKLSALSHEDWQAFADRLAAKGLAGSTVRKILCPIQAVYRRALKRGTVAANPTQGLDLPRADGKRERFATKEEAAALLAALKDADRALWATAIYAGLRRGELRALRWDAVDLEAGLIQVRAGWDDDPAVGEIDLKTASGRRTVAIVPTLREHLAAHQGLTGGSGTGFVFGATPMEVFTASTVRNRALASWKSANAVDAEAAEEEGRDTSPLMPIGLHECRHTYASLMIAAGVNAKALSVMMGHASIAITFDRYGKLMPGSEAEAGAQLDAFLTS